MTTTCARRALWGLLLSWLPTAAPAHALEKVLRFDHITVEDGLAADWVLSIAKDRQGFLWFGTNDGLNRWDGIRLTTYRPDPKDPNSLPSPSVESLYADSRGRLWLGMFRGRKMGAAYYDPGTERFTRLPLDACGGDVRAFHEDAQRRIWFGTDNGGLSRYDEEKHTCTRFPLASEQKSGSESVAVASLLRDRQNRFWVGTTHGLLRFDEASGRFLRFPGRADDPTSLAGADAAGMHEDADGTLWIATFGAGLFRVDSPDQPVRRYLPDPKDPGSIRQTRLRQVSSDGQGRLYIATENGGLSIMDKKSGRFRQFVTDIDDPQSLSSNSIYSLFRDDQGIVWIGTFNGGVNILSPMGQRFGLLRARGSMLNDPHVAAIAEDRQGNLWVGTQGGGLSRRDRAGRFSYYRHDPKDEATIRGDAVRALLVDGNGDVWVGGFEAGLTVIDGRTGRMRHYRANPDDPRSLPSATVSRILELKSGELLVMTGNGAAFFDRRSGVATRLWDRYPDAGRGNVLAGAEDAQGGLWLSSSYTVGVSLQHVDRRNGKVTTYNSDPDQEDGLGESIQALLVDSAGNVWIGTVNGLNCIEHTTGRMRRRLRRRDGLPHDVVTSLLEDGSGHLWLSTKRGLAKLVDAVRLPAEPQLWTFDVNDGLQGQEFTRGAGLRGGDGTLYFGGQHGLTFFQPADIVLNLAPPRVTLTDLKIFNRSQVPGAPGSPLAQAIGHTSSLVLSHRQSVVAFEFAALNYLVPKKNRYAYMLEGFDTEWNEVGTERTASYTNLPAGDFVLRVRASNNDGVRNDDGVALRLRVTPPFYRDRRYLGAAFALLATGVVLAYRGRVRSLQQRQQQLETIVAARTADVEQKRQELLAFNVQLSEKGTALEKENQNRRRAEEEARRFAQALSEKQDLIERENQERRRAEEAAGRERDLLHALMDNIPDLIYFKDADSRYTRVNAACARALGLTHPDQAVGKDDCEFYAEDFARNTREDERGLFRSGEPLLGKLELDARSGRWYLGTKVPIKDEQGQLTGLVGISKDITERKLAEEKVERDLRALLTLVDTAAQGDLTGRGKPGEDTLGRLAGSLNQMLDNFSELLAGVRDAAFSVSSSSTQILAAASEIARGAQYSSDQVHSTTSAVEEMAASMGDVSRNAERSEGMAKEVMDHLRAGEAAVDATAQGMTRIDSSVSETAQKMRLLEQRSKQVFEIIDLIDDIASQSTLLSLNAAIEAAHAGDAGRGFGVVAEEIRRLAERSTGSTRQVTDIVAGIAEETRLVLSAMEGGIQEVAAGRDLSRLAQQSLGAVQKLVEHSADVAEQIASASTEQVRATRTVSQAMQTIAGVTQQSSAGATEATKAVEDLVELSDRLVRAIARFKFSGRS